MRDAEYSALTDWLADGASAAAGSAEAELAAAAAEVHDVAERAPRGQAQQGERRRVMAQLAGHEAPSEARRPGVAGGHGGGEGGEFGAAGGVPAFRPRRRNGGHGGVRPRRCRRAAGGRSRP